MERSPTTDRADSLSASTGERAGVRCRNPLRLFLGMTGRNAVSPSLANPPFNDSDRFRKDDVRWQFGVPVGVSLNH